MRKLLIIGGLAIMAITNAQNEMISSEGQNTAEILLEKEDKLLIGGYGEVHYNQGFSKDVRSNGKLDVHRMVLLFGYSFSNRTKFITEIEFEHVVEVFIEQAFLQHKINDYINFRAGLMLIPMGIINEYHEPTSFHGVERPSLDKSIAPTTWREIGFGVSGNIIPVSLKYQAYLMNGLNGYDGSGKISGKGIRSGRQKGIESFMSAPVYTGKISFYGIRGLNLGLSGYAGKTQSILYDGLDKKDTYATSQADSSVLDIVMLGADARYSIQGIELRAQVYLSSLSNTQAYNHFTRSADGTQNDVAEKMNGFYIEGGYNVFKFIPSLSSKLVPFVRYESFDTQAQVGTGVSANPANAKEIITTGLTWTLAKGAVLKADFQFNGTDASDTYNKVFNAGLGVMF